MSGLVELLAYGLLVPAAVAAAGYWLGRRLFPPRIGERWAAPLAVALGVMAAYALLPDWASLVPQRHWQWLPYLGLLAAVVGPAAQAAQRFLWWRYVIFLALAGVTAAFLVPTWPSLAPSRPISIVLLATYLFAVMALVDALPDRLYGWPFLMALLLTAFGLAALLAAEVSIRFGQLAGMLGAALAGLAVAARFTSLGDYRGTIPVFAVLAGGLAYAGAIEPELPAPALLLAAAAPLALWICARGPLAKIQGRFSIALQCGAVLLPLALALVWMLARSSVAAR